MNRGCGGREDHLGTIPAKAALRAARSRVREWRTKRRPRLLHEAGDGTVACQAPGAGTQTVHAEQLQGVNPASAGSRNHLTRPRPSRPETPRCRRCRCGKAEGQDPGGGARSEQGCHPAPAGAAGQKFALKALEVVSPQGLTPFAAPQSRFVPPADVCSLVSGLRRVPVCGSDWRLRGGEIAAAYVTSGSAAGTPRRTLAALKQSLAL